jgi:hypothetical protein
MLAVEMLNDEKIVERQNELFLTQSSRVPEDHVLLLTFFDRRKLKITKSGVLVGVFGGTGCGSHNAPYWSVIVTAGIRSLQPGVWFV